MIELSPTPDTGVCEEERATQRAVLCIGRKRGENAGLVYDSDGAILGRVFKHARRLRETGGQRGEAWTAYAHTPDGHEVPTSLGTRHLDRWHAARAIREFHRAYTPSNVAPLISPSRFARTITRRTAAEQRAVDLRFAYGRAAARFKYDHYEVCGLTKRYRGGDPRAHEWAAA